MEKLEKLFVEITRNIFSDSNVVFEKKEKDKPYENSTQFQWEEINDKFALKVKDSNYFESLTTSFRKVHSYKWIQGCTDKHKASFVEAFESELRSQGVPMEDVELAKKAIAALSKEYGDGATTNEQDAGAVPNLDKVRETTTDHPYEDEVTTELDDNRKKETMSGDNEPFFGAEPDNVRPVKTKL
jgi:hypothetical protein